MFDIKLIALDLDGTTLNSKSKLTEKTKDTLERAIEKGVHVVIATGRTYSAVPDEVKNIKGIEYLCTSNGAQVISLKEGKVIYSNYISPQAIDETVRILEKENFMIETFVDGIAYTDSENYNKAVKGNLGYRNEKYIVDTRNPVDDIFSFILSNREKIENINVNFKSQEDKKRMKPVLENINDVTVTSSFDHNWEIGGKTTSKAQALKFLCDMLNLKAENIMAAGDSPNDIAMLSIAGLPIAVGNAKNEVKKHAEYIAPSNDEEGISDAVIKFVL